MIRAYADLLRPANVVTALADVLAGYALAGLGRASALPWLLGATACLYAGGVVLNDFFDRRLDSIERPERPIPSGRVPPQHAATIAALLLAAGLILAFRATPPAGVIAAAIASFVVLYDAWGKRHPPGPAIMGLCRALNLLLGVAAMPEMLNQRAVIAGIPFSYVVAITALSRGEVHGGVRRVATFALVSLGIALSGLALVASQSREPAWSGVVLVFLTWRVLPPFVNARRSPDARRIRHAVRTGVLSLVLVNAVIGTAYAGPVYGAMILTIALVAGWLARLFAVT
ncbi:MAG: UbiA-like protein EboC [Vicinamibacterales bacterium]